MADFRDLDEVASKFAVELGRMLREARLEKGLTQMELSKRTGATQQCISFWETGKQLPAVFGLIRVAHALDLELKISFGGE